MNTPHLKAALGKPFNDVWRNCRAPKTHYKFGRFALSGANGMSKEPVKPPRLSLRNVSDQQESILVRLDEIVTRLMAIDESIEEAKTVYRKSLERIDVMGRRLDRLERRMGNVTA